MMTNLKLVRRKNMPDVETHFARLEVVRSLTAQGKSVAQIVTHLEEKQLLLPSQSYSSKYRLVQRLLAKVRQDGAERYRVTKEESDAGLVDYVERHTLLFQLAVDTNQLETARGISKDLARAHGVDTDQPVGVREPDLFTVMVGMKARAANKEAPLQASSLVIDVSPDAEDK